MISAFANTWRIPELRDRILFTLAMIVIVRLGVHITLPGVNASVIKAFIDSKANEDPANAAGGMGAMLTMLSGGGLQGAAIFALGIMPYISASIMIQLMTAVVPKLARLAREDGGREKITQFTRYLTIIIALVQGFFVAKSLTKPDTMPYMRGISQFGTLVTDQSWTWFALVVITVVAGTMFLMWIGDQITDRGIGNGTSIIIVVNIVSSLPGALIGAWKLFLSGKDANAFNSWKMILLLIMLLLVIAGTIALTQAQRRIAVQYAKRVVGRKQFGGQTQYLPLKVNYAGVMPIIFATAVLSLPPMMMGWIWPTNPTVSRIRDALTNFGPWYYGLGALFIFFFSYFWVATMFQPSQIAEDLKRNGGYVPGVRPGKPTAEFLDFTMTRLTFAGAIFLTIIFLLPSLVGKVVDLSPNLPILHFCGGTSLLIMVGVVLDVMRQVETHLIQKHYDGFLRKGKIKGRYDRLAQTGASASKAALIYLWAVIALLVVVGAAAWIYKGH